MNTPPRRSSYSPGSGRYERSYDRYDRYESRRHDDYEDRSDPNPRKIYIGNLPSDVSEYEIGREFRNYGRIVSVESKGRFAFVEYERSREAEDALRAMDGARFYGERITVQPHTPGARGPRGPPSHQVVPPPPRNSGMRPTGKDRRTDYRLLVLNLDDRVSWQDLKDFGRNAGEVNFANVFHRNGHRVGVIEFFDGRTMQKAMDKLHDQFLYDRRVYVDEDRGQLDEDGPSAASFLNKIKMTRRSVSRSRSRSRHRHASPASGGESHRRQRRSSVDEEDRFQRGPSDTDSRNGREDRYREERYREEEEPRR